MNFATSTSTNNNTATTTRMDQNEFYKAVILVGGPSRGKRFRPLSMNQPKPLFPIAGHPLIHHHVSALSLLPRVKQVLIIGYFEPQMFQPFLNQVSLDFPHLQVKYMREYTSLGTGGGLFHFRDQILRDSPSQILILHADICAWFPLAQMMDFHLEHSGIGTIMTTNVRKECANLFGCVVSNDKGQVEHYVEKPETFISDSISCGVYMFRPEIFKEMEKAVHIHQTKTSNHDIDQDVWMNGNPDAVRLEQDILRPLAGSGQLYVFKMNEPWRQLKSAASALPANKLYLHQYRMDNKDVLAPNTPNILGNVFIHSTAQVHPTAKLGPNVSIGPRVIIGKGVRIKESIILDNVEIKQYACIIYSIVGWESKIGSWARIEGSPVYSQGENIQAIKLNQVQTENADDGSIDANILGDNTLVHEGSIIRNCIVLPHKELKSNFFNKILM